jgi:putative DNA primase/helicase
MNADQLRQAIEDAAKKAREAKKSFEVSDIDNANALLEEHGHEIRFCSQQNVWFVYDGKRWVEDFSSVKVEEFTKSTLLVRAIELEKEALRQEEPKRRDMRKRSMNLKKGSTIQAAVRLARTSPEIQVSPADFDANPMLLCVDNGILNLETCTLERHDPSQLQTKLIPIEYDAEAEAPIFQNFLETSLPDPEVIDFIQTLIGYFLTGKTTEQKVFFFIGNGANGKSVLVRVMRALLGEYAVIAQEDLLVKQKFQSHPASAAELKGARLASCNEVEGAAQISEVKVKQLTGGDTLQARRMKENFFRFEPTHKLLMVANYRPEFHDTDEGIWRRVVLVPFEVVIPTEQRDLQLFEKIEKELSGVLAWAVEGCRRWQKDGLIIPHAVDMATADLRAENDPLQTFLEECCIRQGNTEKSVFLECLTRYCEMNSEKVPTAKWVSESMKKKGFKEKKSGVKFWQEVWVRDEYRQPRPNSTLDEFDNK